MADVANPLAAQKEAATEIELKILLDAGAEARLRRHPTLERLRVEPGRSLSLVSIYFDTPDERLAKAGLALRLRRTGRSWTQTVKKRQGKGTSGLYSNTEFETPAPGGRLALAGPDPEGLFEAIEAALDGVAPEPRFETRVQRRVERLRSPGGGIVELALDRGEIVAGALSAPIREAELELIEGGIGDVFAIARALFDGGVIRFAADNKAARGRRLAATGQADLPPAPRQAGEPAFSAGTPIQTVARDLFRDCYGQIAANMALVSDSEEVEGAHQLRVGLRRLRTAFALFGKPLNPDAFDTLAARARDLGREVGRLRDLDVLIGEMIPAASGHGLDPEARQALEAVLEERRRVVRAEVRAALAAPEATAFLFDLAEFIEGQGWRAPADPAQAERLATPVGKLAPKLLRKRLKKVLRHGRHLEDRSPEELHELRKQLKKLRYSVDSLGPAFRGKKVAAYLKTLKALQQRFGDMNDAKAAAELLAAEGDGVGDGVGGDPLAQRAAGFVTGALAVAAEDSRAEVFARWRRLVEATPFWT